MSEPDQIDSGQAHPTSAIAYCGDDVLIAEITLRDISQMTVRRRLMIASNFPKLVRVGKLRC